MQLVSSLRISTPSIPTNKHPPKPTLPLFKTPRTASQHTLPFSTQRGCSNVLRTLRRTTLVPKASDGKWFDSELLDIEGEGVEFKEEDEVKEERKEFAPGMGFSGRREERDYDKDPEFAEILGSCLDDPQKAQTKMKERFKRKRNKILHSKNGSALAMKVTFNKFNFSDSYIWIEFYNAPLQNDVSLICDTIRSWHILGRLGGCNSFNMQLSQSPIEKRPVYDPIQGANVTPTTFYNIGDLEIQDNLARIWVDIGTREPLILDVLINALTQLSSDYVGIKQLVFGGSEFENWRENLTAEDPGFSVHKI